MARQGFIMKEVKDSMLEAYIVSLEKERARGIRDLVAIENSLK